MLVMVGAAAVAGAQRGGWHSAVVGAVVMSVMMMPLLCIGAYARAKEYDRDAIQ